MTAIRTTKTDKLVAKILNALREDRETEEAMLRYVAARYPAAMLYGPNGAERKIEVPAVDGDGTPF